MEFSYDITRTWEENCLRGPRLAPPRSAVPATPLKSFLGLPVRSRIGIAAGLLPNSRWLLPYAARGFDILTYKTVRSSARPCYPLPNWVFVRDPGPPDGPVYIVEEPPAEGAEISSSVCFGMPSPEPGVWREDVRRSREGLAEGQILIVSVVATPGAAPDLDQIAADYARCAAWAVEAGAHVVEANLSCPNVCSAEGTLYQDPRASHIISGQVRRAIGSTPLLLKVGALPDGRVQRELLQAVSGIADGLTLVNGISRPVLHTDGRPVFGERYRTAGVLGRAIHEPSVAAVRAVRQSISAERLPLALAAVGGVATPGDIGDFIEAGADAVLCGSAPMYLPDLALEVKRLHPEW